MADRKPPLKDVPETVTNPTNGKRFLRGRFLGKGGFARCYELIDTETKLVLAGKIVSKTLLVKKHQKDKVTD
jgi:polo-like kinase 1